MTTGWKRKLLARNQSATFCSPVVPGNRHTVAPSSSLAVFTPEAARTMKPWPSYKFTPVKLRPCVTSRRKVQVVARANTSTSPDCRAVKRCWVVVATKRTLDASPNTAAANARQ